MAGRARFHALSEELGKRTEQCFLLDKEPESKTHLDYVCEYLENGGTAKELADELEATLGFEVTTTRLKAYLVERFTAEITEQRLDHARRKSAPAHADNSLAIVDAKAESNVDVARARERAKTRLWMAERYDRERFGQNNQANTTINIGTLHLDALRQLRPVALVAAIPTSASLPANARLIEPASVAEIVTPDAADNTGAEGDNTQHVVASRVSDAG